MSIRAAVVIPQRSATQLGGIVVLGKFVTTPPDALRASQGLAVRIQDGLNLDRIVTWTPEDCLRGVKARWPGVLCLTDARKAQLPGHPDHYGVKLRLHMFDSMPGPFEPPLTATIMLPAAIGAPVDSALGAATRLPSPTCAASCRTGSPPTSPRAGTEVTRRVLAPPLIPPADPCRGGRAHVERSVRNRHSFYVPREEVVDDAEREGLHLRVV
ncbi:MAG: hypothetical protein E6J75_07265 [Deltaproteobacteria bacterium]|nr:MAG: hypothetical protein E6J75_07265 [Deltaproteobacteria bacterium]